MPTGRLRAGLVRVAGVAAVEVHDELLVFQREADLPTFSRAVGAALAEWREARRGGVLNLAGPLQGSEGSAVPKRAGASPGPREQVSSAEVRIADLKDLVRSRFPSGHPLREALLAERDVLAPEEFLAKLEVWSVLLNRRT